MNGRITVNLQSFMIVIILILLNISFDAVYKHVFNIVYIVILFSLMGFFKLRSELKRYQDVLHFYFEYNFNRIFSYVNCFLFRFFWVLFLMLCFSVVYYQIPFIKNYSNKFYHLFYFLICFAYQCSFIHSSINSREAIVKYL